MIPLNILTVLAWFSILFTGRYPKAFFEFTSGVLRWQANVVTYCALLRDEYPPFSWEPGEYPLQLDIPRADRQSRFRLFVRGAAIVPNYIVFYIVEVGWTFTTFLAWFAILLTGRYPRGFFKFSVGVGRWYQRMASYLYLLRDEYPPYSINADARPGNEVVSAIIGAPIFVAYVALSILPVFGVFGGSTTVHASLSPAAISRDHPSGKSGSIRITLLDYDANATTFDASAASGYKFVSFRVRAEKDGFLPTFYWPILLSVTTCAGYRHGLDTSASAFPLHPFWRDGSAESTVYFQIPRAGSVCDLSYFAGRGSIKFTFDGRRVSSSAPPDLTNATPTAVVPLPSQAPISPAVVVRRADLTPTYLHASRPTAESEDVSMTLWDYSTRSSASSGRTLEFQLSIHRGLTSAVPFKPGSMTLTDCGGGDHVPANAPAFDPAVYRYGNAQIVKFEFEFLSAVEPCELLYRVGAQTVLFHFS